MINLFVSFVQKLLHMGHPASEPIENVQVWEKSASSNQEIIGLFYLTVHFTDAPRDPRRSLCSEITKTDALRFFEQSQSVCSLNRI